MLRVQKYRQDHARRYTVLTLFFCHAHAGPLLIYRYDLGFLLREK